MDTTGSNSSSPSPSSSTAANNSDLSLSVSTSSSSTTTATITTRSKRQELSFAERIQVILARKGGKSMRQLALQFGCGKTQILNILGQRESYLREWEEKEGPSNPHIGARKRRSRRTGNEETNRLVWDWYQQQKNSGLRVTGPMLQREARSIARSLGIANFAASNGWLDSFRRLHNIGPQSKVQDQRTPSSTEGAGDAVASSSSAAAAADPLVVDIHPAPEPLPTPSSSVVYEAEFIPIPAPQHYAPATSAQSCATLYEPLAGFALPTAYDQLVDSYDPHNPYNSLGTRDSNEFDPLVDVVGSVTSTSSTDRSVSVNQQAVHPQEQQPEQQQESPSEYKHFANMAAVFHDPPEFDASLMHHHSSLIYPTAIPATVYGDDGSAASFTGGALQSHSAAGTSSASFLGSLEDVFQLPTYSAVSGRSQLADESAPAAHCPLPLATTEDESTVVQPAKVTPSPFKSVIQSHPGLDPLLPLDLGDLQQQEQPQQAYPASTVRRSVLVSTRSAAASSTTEEKRRRLISTAEDLAAAAPDYAYQSGAALPWTSAPSDGTVADQGVRPPSADESVLPSYAGLVSMARSRSLQALTYRDGEGSQWLEIRPVAAACRVPLHGYRTHLVRMIVDQKLNYWIEAVGRCVRSGSFRPPSSAPDQITADPALAAPTLDAVAGGFSVCQGRGSVLKRVGQFHPRLVVQHAATERMSFTLPDYRYRSFDCSYWIDSRTGPRCAACRASYRRPSAASSQQHLVAALVASSSDSASASPRSSPGEPLNLSLHTPQDTEEMPGLQPITVLHLAGQSLLHESEDTSCSSYLTIDHDHRLAQETARCMTLHGHPMAEDRPPEWRSLHDDSQDADKDVLEAEFEAIAVKQEPMDSPTESSSSSRDSQRLQ